MPQRFDQQQAHQSDQNSGDDRIQTIIEDQTWISARRRQLSCLRQKADAWIGISYLVPRSRERDDHQPREWRKSYKSVLSAMHLDDDCCRYTQCNSRQQLIGNPEQRPQRINSAERIAHPLP